VSFERAELTSDAEKGVDSPATDMVLPPMKGTPFRTVSGRPACKPDEAFSLPVAGASEIMSMLADSASSRELLRLPVELCKNQDS